MRAGRLIALACAVVSLAPEPGHAGEGALFVRPAGDAIVVGDRLVYAQPDFRSVVAVEPTTGKRLWRATIGGQGEGTRLLQALGSDRVAVVTGDTVHLLNAGDGAIVGRTKPGQWAAVARPGCWLDEREGACALSCPCTFQPVSCRTLDPIGSAVVTPRYEVMTPDGRWTTECPGRRGEILGRAGDLVLMAASATSADRGPAAIAPSQLSARRVSDGQTVWTSGKLGARRPSPRLSGVAGELCWVGDSSGELAVFGCGTGRVLWQRRYAPTKKAPLQAERVTGGLLVRDGPSVRLARLDSGASAWSIHAPDARVLPSQFPHGGVAVVGSARAVQLVDAGSGATTAILKVPSGRGAQARRLPDFWLLSTSESLATYDGAGNRLGEITLDAASQLSAGQGALALRSPGALTLLRQPTLLPIAEHKGTYDVVAIEGVLGRGIVALLRHSDEAFDPSRPETFGELQLRRITAHGSRRR